MYRFIETLCVRKGKIQHLVYHQQRVDQTRRTVLGLDGQLSLNQLLQLPDEWKNIERVKCRIVYSSTLEESTFTEYLPRAIRSLRLVTHDTIQYNYKFEDRRLINHLFARRGAADDVLIVKDGIITDTSYSNVAFFDGQQWFTPHQPLLPGTARTRLLNEGILKEAEITPGDLSRLTHCSLLNAKLPLGECAMPDDNIGW